MAEFNSTIYDSFGPYRAPVPESIWNPPNVKYPIVSPRDPEPGPGIWRKLNIALFHFLRLGGIFWVIFGLLFYYPLPAVFILTFYYGWLAKQRFWIGMVRTWARYAYDPRFRLVKTGPVNPNQNYVITMHPHGLLVEGCFYSFTVRRLEAWKMFPGLAYATSGGKALEIFPFIRELFNKANSVSPSRHAIKKYLTEKTENGNPRSVAIAVGGFSEAVFSSADSPKEYAYIKGRLGFIELALETGADLVPVYSFGLTKLYNSSHLIRGWRARFAQKWTIPMVLWFGRWWTSQPFDVEVYTVVGTPFSLKGYTKETAHLAHEAYCEHVTKFYNQYKDVYGMGDKELEIIGKDFRDEDWLANLFRRFGYHSSVKVHHGKKHDKKQDESEK